jgi:patatin-like phospholipase/acyl hydrolase
VLPFRITNAPAVFQGFISGLFADLFDTKLVVYIDDILVFTETATEHSSILEEVFRRTKQNALFVNLEKSKFYQVETVFVGYQISENMIEPDPEKVGMLRRWVKPDTVKKIGEILGLY